MSDLTHAVAEPIFANEPQAVRWAIVERDSKTGQVQLILWAPTSAIIPPESQEAAMLRHPDILKVWRLEEIK